MRLRRFLMTEPTENLTKSGSGCRCRPPGTAGVGKKPRISLADVGHRALHGLGDSRFRHTIAASEAHGRQFTGVHQTVDRHLRDAHELGDLRDREEAHGLGATAVNLCGHCDSRMRITARAVCGMPSPQSASPRRPRDPRPRRSASPIPAEPARSRHPPRRTAPASRRPRRAGRRPGCSTCAAPPREP
ncbi:hypothetical protein COLO4_01246 [Corchorus olitorius]|uniref:Uncharacterized protein n=1 Tax=Corchorus olitorius TaxID=93759 RepID=A0A1R3L2X4_9ROSI|nr:hypothetical protein COLO4_01246 [Corchorus olitorius]